MPITRRTASAARQSPEALEHTAGLYAVEQGVRGRPPYKRRCDRQASVGPPLAAFRQRLDATGPKLARRSDLVVPIRYALGCWLALSRYVQDGRFEIDNNAADRLLRGIAPQGRQDDVDRRAGHTEFAV